MLKKGFIIGGIVLLVLVFLVYGSMLQRGGDSDKNESVLGQAEPPLPTVKAATVEERDLRQSIIFHGRFAPYSQVVVMPKLPGIVKEVFCRVGDDLEEGDPILQMETEELILQVRQAEASLQVAKANQARVIAGARIEEVEQAQAGLRQAEVTADQAQRNYDRSKKLFEQGVISASDWEGIEAQYEGAKTQLVNAEKTLAMIQQGAREEDILQAKASVDQAEVALELTQLNLKNATITAPITGTISRLMAEKGAMTGSGMAVATIVDVSTVKLHLQAIGRDVVRIQEGQSTFISVDALPHQVFQGTVSTISPAAEEGSGLFAVTIEIQNKERILRSGMYATAEIVIVERTNAVAVPSSAVFTTRGERSVFLVEEGTVKRIPVETGIEENQYVEINGRIHVGDRVVVTGFDGLEDGMSVQVTEWSDHR